MNRHYPASLFLLGVLMNVLFHFFWLSVPGIILLLAGIFAKPCLYIGTAVLALDLVLSIIEQLRIRKTILEESDNPNFRSFQNSVFKPGNWRDNMRDYMERIETDESDSD